MEEDDRRRRLVFWVAEEIIPCEPAVRAWLARSLASHEDVDDLIQEAYCKIAALDTISHIERPRAFFFQTVRNLLINQIRRSRVVRIDAAVDLDIVELSEIAPSPETIVGDRREWSRVQSLISALPDRCRRILELRKIEGLSQREIAGKLDISENVVENEGSRGLLRILQGLREQSTMIAEEYQARRQRGQS